MIAGRDRGSNARRTGSTGGQRAREFPGDTVETPPVLRTPFGPRALVDAAAGDENEIPEKLSSTLLSN